MKFYDPGNNSREKEIKENLKSCGEINTTINAYYTKLLVIIVYSHSELVSESVYWKIPNQVRNDHPSHSFNIIYMFNAYGRKIDQ